MTLSTTGDGEVDEDEKGATEESVRGHGRAMADAEDDVSITSTVLSDQEAEYEVETILTEQKLGNYGETYYLVKWAGYPIERCTWEPAESFCNEETFEEWSQKKKEIADGKRPPFDLESWERYLTGLERAREQRKRRREAKRKRHGVSRAQVHADKERKRADAAAVAAAGVAPATTSPVLPASAGAPGPPTQPNQSPVARTVPLIPPMVMFSSSQTRQGPWMASRQKRPVDGDVAPRPFTLSARRRFEKAKGHEHPPDIQQLDLLKPSDWSPRTGYAMSTPKLGHHAVISPTEGSPSSPRVPNRPRFEDDVTRPLESRVSWGSNKRPGSLESRVSRGAERSPPQIDTRRTEALESRISSVPDRRPETDTWGPEPLESRMSWGPNISLPGSERRAEPLESRISSGHDKRPLADTWRSGPLQHQASCGSEGNPQRDDLSSETPRRSVTMDSWKPNSQPTSPRTEAPPRRPISPTPSRNSGPQHPVDESFDIRNEDIPPLPPRLINTKGALNRLAKDHNSQYRNWNSGEVFADMYFGPNKTYTGPMRLCGLKRTTIFRIMQSKRDNKVDVWFQEVYSPEEYWDCCDRSSFNTTYDNGWVEGYDDTEPNLYKTGELLRRGPYVAVAYPEPGTPRNVIIAYSPFSSDFGHLHRGNEPSAQTFLCLNFRNPISRPANSSFFAKISQSQIPMHAQKPERPNTPKLPEAPKPCDGPKPSAGPLSDRSPLIEQEIEGTKKQEKQVMQDLEIGQDKNSDEHGDTIMAESPDTPVLQESQKEPQAAEAYGQPLDQSLGQLPGQSIEESAVSPTTAVSKTNDISVEDFDVNNFFRDVFKMPFETLSSINGSRTKTNVFYVMCPGEDITVQAEREVLLEFLKRNESVIYSNRLEEDWERFVRTLNKGIVLFHESFVNYDEMSNIRALIKKQFTFWSFSLTGFGSGDDKTHFQRVFPHGGVILMTEDFMLHEPDATVIILTWFNDWTKKRFPGMWKIMFRPNILDWLLQQNEPREDARKGIWLAMYSLIMQLGTNNDPDSILSDGIHDAHSQSRAISPHKIPLYGCRTDDDYIGLNVPKGLDQQTRDADHLAEFFAGWALVNCHHYRRFTILTSVKPLERWNHWNHVEFFSNTMKFFEQCNIDYKVYWQKLRSSLKPSAMSEDRQAQLSSNSVSSPDSATPIDRS